MHVYLYTYISGMIDKLPGPQDEWASKPVLETVLLNQFLRFMHASPS